MVDGVTVNVATLLDQRPLARSVPLLILCFLVMLSEGYDLGVVGYVAPSISKSFGLHAGGLAATFSGALVGMLAGALGAGVIGDRYGRRLTILGGLAVIGVASVGCALAPTVQALMTLRVVVGLGLGALLPNVTALMAEFLPGRARGAFTTLAFLGITVGGILPGAIAGLGFGKDWRLLLGVGAALPLIVLPVLLFCLPESIRFLLVREGGSARARKMLSTIAPGVPLPPEATFILDERTDGNASLADLFRGPLALGTPALWLCFAIVMLVNFFVSSWLATVLASLGYTPERAAATASLYYVGGVGGGLSIGYLLDRIGPVCLIGSALLAAAAMAAISLHGLDGGMLRLLVLAIGFGVLGTQLGLSAVAGLLYPTRMRAKGAGSAHAVGRVGAILGPIVAGRLLAGGLHGPELFLVPVPVLGVMAACLLGISLRWNALTASGRALTH